MPEEGRKKVKVGTKVSADKLRQNEFEGKEAMKDDHEFLKKQQVLESNAEVQCSVDQNRNCFKPTVLTTQGNC